MNVDLKCALVPSLADNRVVNAVFVQHLSMQVKCDIAERWGLDTIFMKFKIDAYAFLFHYCFSFVFIPEGYQPLAPDKRMRGF